MSPVFADTFYFLALVNPQDQAHAKARVFSESSDLALVTTAWVLTELGDALSRVPNRPVFWQLLQAVARDPHTQVAAATQELFDKGIALFAGRPDKDWSLTDCISFVVMQEQGLTEALTGDHHFEQAGFKILLK